MLKFNKGEWSEPYCFLKIISEKKLSVCNDELMFVGTEIKVTGGRLSDDVLYTIRQALHDINLACYMRKII